jgi:CBS domain-containing protein/anti-sigma regulatory factor (Ser/Thr protein kinase)
MIEEKRFTKIQELTFELKVGDVMTKNVVTVSPKQVIQELRSLLRDRRISGAPVVNGEGTLIGIISIEDFIECLAEGEGRTLVEEKMSTDPAALDPEEPLVHAVTKFDALGYGRFPVVDKKTAKVVGIITKGDIVRGLLKKLEIDYHEEEIHRYRASHIFQDILADRAVLDLEYNVIGQDFNRAGESSSNLKKTLYRLGIRPDSVRKAAIVAYEAEMNIVAFTNGGTLRASVQPEIIRIDAMDSGPGIADIEQAMQPGFSTAPEFVREMGFGAGMGLVNIKNCADKMNIVSEPGKGTHVEAVVDLN